LDARRVRSHPVTIAVHLSSAAFVAACTHGAAEEVEVRAEPAVKVQIEPVSAMVVPESIRLTGNLRGNREVDLAANAAGRVIRTDIERGQLVKMGQVLAQLDVRAASLSAVEARAQAESAEAEAERARLDCERSEGLHQRGAIADAEYQLRMTQCRTIPLSFEAATARARLAAQNVGDGLLRAPFDGVVTDRYVEVGQYLRQDSRVISLASLDPLRLEMAVPEAEVAKVHVGAAVSFAVPAYPDRRFDGEIRYVSGAVRQTTRDLIAEAVVPNADGALKPGMFAEVELVTGWRALPSLPRAAIVGREGDSHAFFVVGGRLEERVLALGPAIGDRVSVAKGARDGEQVALGGPAELSNGARVQ
jgi:membrane fusion protein (multidrug efflux system)